MYRLAKFVLVPDESECASFVLAAQEPESKRLRMMRDRMVSNGGERSGGETRVECTVQTTKDKGRHGVTAFW